ncbi:MAG: DNA polymerase III subunit delta, partial [Desulfobulbaceae bacterium]|nr:DNA polymerase III subunit delta [Desulfobulbaceae bacterium]
ASGWRKCFGFARPAGDLSWTGKLLAAAPEGQATAAAHDGDPAELLQKILTAGIPTANVLILLSEEVDKRKRLFKLLKDKYVIIDVSVDTGSSARAQKEQKSVLHELVQKTLAEMGKTMAPPVTEQLFERVGFHPVGVVMETEKLALFIGDRKQINREDLDAIVGRTRQEALFELTGALGEHNLERALLIAGRLQENGIHALAVVATLRNYARTLLLFRSLQEQPQYGYRPSMASTSFQQQCLPRLKEQERWKKELTGHPYALYMQFKTASGFSIATLKQWMQLILSAEMRLKGSPVKAGTVLHHLIFSMLSP